MEDRVSQAVSGYFQMPRMLKGEEHLGCRRRRCWVVPRTENSSALVDQTLTKFGVFRKQN